MTNSTGLICSCSSITFKLKIINQGVLALLSTLLSSHHHGSNGFFIQDSQRNIVTDFPLLKLHQSPSLLHFSSQVSNRRFDRSKKSKMEYSEKNNLSVKSKNLKNSDVIKHQNAVDDSSDDLSHWERLYFGRSEAYVDSTLESKCNIKQELSHRVRVVTFDLDNTLWRTKETIDDANDSLFNYLQHVLDGRLEQRIEQYMKTLHDSNPSRYCPNCALSESNEVILNDDKPPHPIQLTLLRKDAIKEAILQISTNQDIDWVEEKTAEAFDIWMKARQDSIQKNLAVNVVETLQRIKETIPNVVFGAITDGNCNPMEIHFLSPYFDFCLNAETVGVSKPNKKIYIYALQNHIIPLLLNSSSFTPSDTLIQRISKVADQIIVDKEPATDTSNLEAIIGPWWVHVGDDFGKDIVAAKNLNIRTIWCRELIMTKEELEDKMKSKEQIKAYVSIDSTRTIDDDQQLSDFLREVSQIGKDNVIEMQIGSDDYLIDSIQREFCDAIVARFLDVAIIVEGWTNLAKRVLDNNSIHSLSDEDFERIIS